MAGMYPNNQSLEIFGEQVMWPGMGADGKFTNGSFEDPGIKPSFIPAKSINLLIDNLSALIEKCGGTPDAVNGQQLADIITHLATAKKLVMRDVSGRAKVAAPLAEDDIARKAEITAALVEAGTLVSEAATALETQIADLRNAQTGYALYEGGRNLLSVFGVSTLPELFAILHEKCNGAGRPDFDNLFIGDYVDIPSLIVDGTTYANQRILLSGFNHYKNLSAPEGYRNPQNHILFTFDKIVMRRNMNPSNVNTGGYPSSGLRTFLEGVGGDGSGLFAIGLREAIGDYLYTVKKYASIKGAMAWGNYTVFPPTALEVGASLYWDSNGIYPDDEDDTAQLQKRFLIFNIRRWRKLQTGQSAGYNSWWWTSSPYCGDTASFVEIANLGIANNSIAGGVGGVSPAFCVA